MQSRVSVEAEIVIPEEKKAELSDYITELEKIFKKSMLSQIRLSALK